MYGEGGTKKEDVVVVVANHRALYTLNLATLGRSTEWMYIQRRRERGRIVFANDEDRVCG